MEKFFGLILLAIIIEGITTYIRTWFVDKHVQWQQVFTCALGLLIAIAYRLDLIALFGFESTLPYLGNVLTGILLSRGSNYIFDLIKKLINATAGKVDDLDE